MPPGQQIGAGQRLGRDGGEEILPAQCPLLASTPVIPSDRASFGQASA